MRKQSIFLLSAFSIFCLIFTLSEKAPAEKRTKSPEEIKLKEEAIRHQMLQISKELGVTCTECHTSSNWRDSSKNTFKVAQEHIKLVEMLRAQSMNGKNKNPEASCFMCHRGQLHYNWRADQF